MMEEQERRAVIVGINEYKDSENIETLSGAEGDAKDIYERLSDPNIGDFKISKEKEYLVGENATFEKIREAISKLFWKPEKKANLALFYFSGHGFQDGSGNTYIAPYDMIKDEPFLHGINLEELMRLFNNPENDTNIIILDCCYGDAATKKGKSGEFKNGMSDKLFEEYLFGWDKIPGNDNWRLEGFLLQNFGIDWVKKAKIEKIDDGKTIKLSAENNHISLKLNNEKTRVNIEIDDGRTDEFIVKKENGELNISFKDNERGSGRYIIASTGVDRSAREKKFQHKKINNHNEGEHKHGIFSYHLIEGLDGDAPTEEGKIFLNQLISYVEDHVSKDNQKVEFKVTKGCKMDRIQIAFSEGSATYTMLMNEMKSILAMENLNLPSIFECCERISVALKYKTNSKDVLRIKDEQVSPKLNLYKKSMRTWLVTKQADIKHSYKEVKFTKLLNIVDDNMVVDKIPLILRTNTENILLTIYDGSTGQYKDIKEFASILRDYLESDISSQTYT